jgi:hypothetical protein
MGGGHCHVESVKVILEEIGVGASAGSSSVPSATGCCGGDRAHHEEKRRLMPESVPGAEQHPHAPVPSQTEPMRDRGLPQPDPSS